MLCFRTWPTAKPFSKIQHFIAHDGTPEAKNCCVIKEQIQFRQLATFLEAKKKSHEIQQTKLFSEVYELMD